MPYTIKFSMRLRDEAIIEHDEDHADTLDELEDILADTIIEATDLLTANSIQKAVITIERS